MLNKLTIKNKPNQLGLYDILLDDKPIQCTNLKLELDVDAVPQVTITTPVTDIDVDIDGVNIDENERDIKQNFIEALQEVIDYQLGKKSLKTWNEYLAEQKQLDHKIYIGKKILKDIWKHGNE